MASERNDHGGGMADDSVAGATGSVDLPSDLGSAREARRFVADCASRLGRPGVAELAELLVSELVTNAVAHARTGVAIQCVPTRAGIRVVVRDGSADLPSPRHPDPWDERGRGLLLVETLASRWGTQSVAPCGKAV